MGIMDMESMDGKLDGSQLGFILSILSLYAALWGPIMKPGGTPGTKLDGPQLGIPDGPSLDPVSDLTLHLINALMSISLWWHSRHLYSPAWPSSFELSHVMLSASERSKRSFTTKPAQGEIKTKRELGAPCWSPVHPKVLSESVCAPSRSACSPKARDQTGSLPRSSPRATNCRPPLSEGREPREDDSSWTVLKLTVAPHHLHTQRN